MSRSPQAGTDSSGGTDAGTSDLPGILFLFRYNEPRLFGGVPRKMLLIAEWLKEHRVLQPVLLTSRDGEFARAFAALGLPVRYVDMSGWGALRRTAGAAEALITEYRVTLVQTHRFWDSIAGRIVRRRHPELRHLFRVHTYIAANRRSQLRKKLYYLLDRRTSKHVDRYCALTEMARAELNSESGIAPEKTSVVRNGIPALAGEHRRSDSGRPVPPRFAIVGDIDDNKRQDLAVRALRALKDRGIAAELTLVGREVRGFGDTVRAVAAELEVAEQVTFSGFAEDVSAALRDIEVVVLPSELEGIPTSILEAMSAGKIAVATAVGGVVEFMRDRENGFLIPRGDWRALAETLHELFTTPARRWVSLREAAYRTWQEEFSLEVMMQKLTDEYRTLGVVT